MNDSRRCFNDQTNNLTIRPASEKKYLTTFDMSSCTNSHNDKSLPDKHQLKKTTSLSSAKCLLKQSIIMEVYSLTTNKPFQTSVRYDCDWHCNKTEKTQTNKWICLRQGKETWPASSVFSRRADTSHTILDLPLPLIPPWAPIPPSARDGVPWRK